MIISQFLNTLRASNAMVGFVTLSSSELKGKRRGLLFNLIPNYLGAQIGVKGTRRSLEIAFYPLPFSLWISNFQWTSSNRS